MRFFLILCGLLAFVNCKEIQDANLTAQQVIDRAIQVSGGVLYSCSNIDFVFRDRTYSLEYDQNRKVLKRMFQLDTGRVLDIRRHDGFDRFINDQPVAVADSMARKYANSINSVHYFAYLPYGLNDPAVNKKLLPDSEIKGREYYTIQVTFDQEDGGDDFEDVYIYWINKETYKPDYLAYEFHVDGGGIRFREAYNERFINGIRFVDYSNYKPVGTASLQDIDQLFTEGKLELLSKVELEDIRVNADNCN